ncbi:hypothetical protein PTKIN_Ptkin04bG0122600 [Pterospermum kingtungense]
MRAMEKSSQQQRSDWRANLFTVFFNNLSRRVSRNALWEAFEAYGRVVDIFILDHSKRPFCFAFVRYRSVEECRRVVRDGNGRRIDGMLILVKEEGKKPCANLTHEDNAVVNEQSELVLEMVDRIRKVMCPEEIHIDIDIPAKEIEWLSRSVFAAIKDTVGLDDVKEFLTEAVHLWNVRFFEQLGNAWGEFIRTDECIAKKKKRLDHARMLIKVDSLLRAHSIATVVVKREKFKISVALEDGIGLNNGDNITTADDGLPESSYLAKPLRQSNSHELERICFDEVYCMGSNRVATL